MAVIEPVPLITEPTPGLLTVRWETLTESDTALGWSPGSLGPLAASVQVIGTWGGGTIIWQGSNIGPDDSDEWVALNDPSGTAISLTADGGAELSSAFRWFRPNDSVAGTSRDVDAYMTVRF